MEHIRQSESVGGLGGRFGGAVEESERSARVIRWAGGCRRVDKRMGARRVARSYTGCRG